jgi:hypothetical protein
MLPVGLAALRLHRVAQVGLSVVGHDATVPDFVRCKPSDGDRAKKPAVVTSSPFGTTSAYPSRVQSSITTWIAFQPTPRAVMLVLQSFLG